MNKILLIKNYYSRLWGEKDLTAVDHYCHQDLKVYTTIGPNIEYKGSHIFKRKITEWFKGFPNIKVICNRIYEEEDTIICEWTTNLTHSGDFRGYVATGNTFINEGTSIFKIHDGKIIERKDVYNASKFLKELTFSPIED